MNREQLQDKVEVLERQRVTWLLINLIGFCVWDGLRIVDRYGFTGPSYPVITGLMLMGWLAWVSGLWQVFRLKREMNRDQRLLHMLNDERVEHNRFRAWRIGLIAVVLTQVAILSASLFAVEISGALAADLTILVAVAVATGGFLYNDASDA